MSLGAFLPLLIRDAFLNYLFFCAFNENVSQIELCANEDNWALRAEQAHFFIPFGASIGERVLVNKTEADYDKVRLVIAYRPHSLKVIVTCCIENINHTIPASKASHASVRLKNRRRLILRKLLCSISHHETCFPHGTVSNNDYLMVFY